MNEWDKKLRQTAFNGDLELAIECIAKGASLSQTEYLFNVTKNNQLHIIKYLISNNYITSSDLFNISQWSCFFGHKNLIKYLLDNKLYSIDDEALLRSSVSGNKNNITEYLLNYMEENNIISEHLIPVLFNFLDTQSISVLKKILLSRDINNKTNQTCSLIPAIQLL